MSLKDEKERYLRLTLALYRVVDLFPEGDVLRQQIRKKANKVLADLIWSNPHPRVKEVCEGIASLNDLFSQAEAQNFIDPRNFQVLKREYQKIAENMQENSQQPETEQLIEDDPIFEISKESGMNRKKKILNFLKSKQRIRVGELVASFPDVSRRTLIRDLDELYKGGIIIRTGDGRGANYTIKL
jgi:DNA-binding transcriptional ArsR family regulator